MSPLGRAAAAALLLAALGATAAGPTRASEAAQPAPGLALRLVTDAAQGLPPHPDMLAVGEGGRVLYASHERFGPLLARGAPSLSRIDLHTGRIRILVRGLRAADGLKATPWGTLLLGEEHGRGRVWEVDPDSGRAVPRPLLGRFAHEGLAVRPDGVVYLADEHPRGALYRFLPAGPPGPRALTAGRLEVLTPRGWRAVAHPERARAEARALGAVALNRTEDLALGPHGRLYLAVTGEHRVLLLEDRPKGPSPRLQAFVPAGSAPPGERPLRWPDNLAFDAAGRLYVTEDPPWTEQLLGHRARVLAALPDRDGDGRSDGLLTLLHWAPTGTEPSGLVFGPRGTLYLTRLEGKRRGAGAVLALEGLDAFWASHDAPSRPPEPQAAGGAKSAAKAARSLSGTGSQQKR